MCEGDELHPAVWPQAAISINASQMHHTHLSDGSVQQVNQERTGVSWQDLITWWEGQHKTPCLVSKENAFWLASSSVTHDCLVQTEVGHSLQVKHGQITLSNKGQRSGSYFDKLLNLVWFVFSVAEPQAIRLLQHSQSLQHPSWQTTSCVLDWNL